MCLYKIGNVQIAKKYIRNLYEYYLTGPMKRIEIGEDSLQGVDYIYNINGWLKAINNSVMNRTPSDDFDPGKDGLYSTTQGDEKKYICDGFGMVLGYNENDFVHTSNNGRFNSSLTNRLQNHTTTTPPDRVESMYNGMVSNIESFDLHPLGGQFPTGYKYKYDLIYRLKNSGFYDAPALVWHKANNYAFSSSYNYDKNGNFQNLYRNENNSMDELSYNYIGNSNKLLSVLDGVSNYFTNPSNIESRSFEYDESGYLTRDEQEGILKIDWTSDGKVNMVIYSYESDNITPKEFIRLWYNANGMRVKKLHRFIDAEVKYNEVFTYYALDANGKIMAIYDKIKPPYETTPEAGPIWAEIFVDMDHTESVDDFFDPLNTQTTDTTKYVYRNVNFMGERKIPDIDLFNPGLVDGFDDLLSKQFPKASEFHFYGTEQDQRIGIKKNNKPVYYFAFEPDGYDEFFLRELKLKEYEIKDYLGNIRLVFSDMKQYPVPVGSGPFSLEIRNVMNYYPYGMLQPD
jgi:hypothetical protein